MIISMIDYLKVRLACKKGQGMVEYGLIIGLIAILVIVAVTAFKDQLVVLFGKITGVITTTNNSLPSVAAPAST